MTEKPEPFRFFALNLQTVAERLSEGWVFDPWLCGKGYPVMTGENTCYWVLVRPEALDDPEALARAAPFKPLAAEPVAEKPVGYGTVYVPHVENVDATEPWAAKGYVLLHKDHVTSKGTILTLTEKKEEAKAMIADNRKLPQWALDRGHPFPDHYYYFTDDERLMVRCPSENTDLNLFSWKCPHEPKEAEKSG